MDRPVVVGSHRKMQLNWFEVKQLKLSQFSKHCKKVCVCGVITTETMSSESCETCATTAKMRKLDVA